MNKFTSDIVSSESKHVFFLGFVLPLICLLAYSLTFLPFIADDALISLRYVQRFLAGDGLTWTDGIPVEGYSNLSWVLAISGLAYLGLDLILASRLLAAGLYASILWMNWCYWRPFLTDANRQFFYLAQYAFAFSATTGVWLVGGLEQPLVGASIAWSLFYILRDQQSFEQKNMATVDGFFPQLKNSVTKAMILSSLSLGILCLTRPDSPLICVCFALALVIVNGVTRQSILRIAVLAFFPLLFVIGQLLFRLDYYDQWVATPALIKVQPSISTFLIGFLYVLAGLLCLAPFSYYCLRTLLKARQSCQRFLIIISSTSLSIWLLYLLLIGGDIFPAFRHFTLVSVFFSLLFPAVEFYFNAENRENDQPFQFNAVQISIMAFVYIALQWFNPGTAFARGHLWVWDGEVIANAMKTGFAQQQPKLAVDAAGALPYWTGYPVVDMLGLNDYHIARTEPSKAIKYVGHQFGDGDYVYQQQPDIINFCFPKGFFHPCWKSGTELWANTDFHKNYLPVRISGESPFFVEGVQWFYKWSDITGIQREQNAWSIPSYFFSLNAKIANTDLEKPIITSAEQDDIPAHLIRSYIAEDSHWQIDVPANGKIELKFYRHPFADIADITVSFIPDNHFTVRWSKPDNDGSRLLTLTSNRDTVSPLQRVKLFNSHSE